ncbi:TetR/AcrR family transcriptional regulator [Paenibacillus sp. NPDC057934]|uniref:TetR/AcrR family transcriptional regulator n=1 Tax=Paenibacillus sp. NPDC057934 TaxID=3346282 RepID=UPI0036DA08E9
MPISEVNASDPRVIRTRQLIIDAYIDLLTTKEFNAITVSDISKLATINRATFYAHFTDKFSLTDSYFSASFMDFVNKRVGSEADLSEETIKLIVISLCEYHVTTNQICKRNYEAIASYVEKDIKAYLEDIIFKIMVNDCKDTAEDTLRIAANILTWSIYGITYRWNMEKRPETPQEFAVKILPILKGGYFD